MYIKDSSNDDIGKVLVDVCLLADLDVPKEPKMVVDFIRKYFGKYEIDCIKLAMDKWVMGAVDVRKPLSLNAQFVSTVIYKAIKDGYITKDNIYQKEEVRPLNKVVLTDDELLDGYNLLRDTWFKYERTGLFDSFLKFYEVRYTYIYRKFDVMAFEDDVRLSMIEELKSAIINRDVKQAEKNITVGGFMSKIDTPVPNVNWNRVACVCLHYRSLWQKKIIEK